MANISDLFKQYDQANEEWLKAKKLVEEKYKIRSSLIEQIHEANSFNKKIKRKTANGVIKSLTICKRGDTYFFRGENDDPDVVE